MPHFTSMGCAFCGRHDTPCTVHGPLLLHRETFIGDWGFFQIYVITDTRPKSGPIFLPESGLTAFPGPLRPGWRSEW